MEETVKIQYMDTNVFAGEDTGEETVKRVKKLPCKENS